MARIPHTARRYGYKIKRRFQEAPFSFLVLWAVFLSLIFLVFAFRGLIATMFIRPLGIVNPNTETAATSVQSPDTTPTPEASIKLKSTGTYTVQSGDTLFGIAVEVGSTTEKLAELNDLEPPYSLSVGQELKLP
ncbi:MAG: LysM peptidoglycan-binding domain-containing protein [Patescibacteria group bacterium]|nr:LysM peptidoglycan-binding domain-containing protein [Patescibacteria group bacterium]